MRPRRCRRRCWWWSSGWSASTTPSTCSIVSFPRLVFLASIFVIAEAVRAAGLFERAGACSSRGPHTSVRRLLVAISLAAVAVTTVMSLDATAVLFTPVVIGLVRSRHTDSERPLLVTTQLANAGSGLLPVSNLTNLLVFSATGLTFGGFAVRMLLPTAAASAVVVWVVCRRPRGPRTMEPDASPSPPRLDRFARFVIAALARALRLVLRGLAARGRACVGGGGGRRRARDRDDRLAPRFAASRARGALAVVRRLRRRARRRRRGRGATRSGVGGA